MLTNAFVLSSADFFEFLTYSKTLSGALSECQTIWTQIRTDSVCVWGGVVWGFVLRCVPTGEVTNEGGKCVILIPNIRKSRWIYYPWFLFDSLRPINNLSV